MKVLTDGWQSVAALMPKYCRYRFWVAWVEKGGGGGGRQAILEKRERGLPTAVPQITLIKYQGLYSLVFVALLERVFPYIWKVVSWRDAGLASTLGGILIMKCAMISLRYLVVLLLIIASFQLQAGTIRFTCIAPEGTPVFKYANQIYSQVFKELGYRFELMSVTPKKVFDLFEANKVDGDCGHVERFASELKTQLYLQVPSAITAVSYGAWSNKPLTYLLKGKNGSDLRAGYIENTLGALEIFSDAQHTNIKAFPDSASGLRELRKGNIDIWVNITYSMKQWHSLQRPKYFSLIRAYPVYPYLHTKYKQLLKPMSELLQRKVLELPYSKFLTSQVLSVNPKVIPDNAIHFNCPVRRGSSVFQTVNKLYETAFSALGREFYMSYAPSARSIVNIKSGLVDGDCGRGDNFLKSEGGRDFVRVDAPVARVKYRVWSYSPDHLISNINDILKGHYSVAYRNGVRIDELFKLYPSIKVYKTTSAEQALKMMAARRVDVFIDIDEVVVDLLQGTQLLEPIYNVGTLLEVDLYPVMHKKHSALAKQLSDKLKSQSSKENTYLLDGRHYQLQ